MKILPLFFLTLMLCLGTLRAGAVEDGNAAFGQGDYATAARAYETALAAGPKSAGLYFNLASAQLKNGQKTDAALNLRRAILLDPRMTDARMALSELEKSQGIVVRSGWEERVVERAPLRPAIIAGCVVAWFGAFLLLYGVFKRGKRLLPIFASIVLVLLGGGIVTAGYLADPLIRDAKSGVVSADGGATLLSAPADQSAVIAKLPACAPVKILRQSGEWTYCETADGAKGWTSAKGLTPVLPAT